MPVVFCLEKLIPFPNLACILLIECKLLADKAKPDKFASENFYFHQ